VDAVGHHAISPKNPLTPSSPPTGNIDASGWVGNGGFEKSRKEQYKKIKK
jgi:hypothetical protein